MPVYPQSKPFIRTSSHTPEVNPDSLVEDVVISPKSNTRVKFISISNSLEIAGILQRMLVDLQDPTDKRITLTLSNVPNDENLRKFIAKLEYVTNVEITFDEELYYTSNDYVPVHFQLIREGELELVLKSN